MSPSAPFTSASLTRRQLLLAGAGGLVVAACGSGGGSTSAATTAPPAGTSAGKGVMLVAAFNSKQPVGKPLRLPLTLADKDGAFITKLPTVVRVHVRKPDGTTSDPLTIPLHDKDLPRGYYPLSATFDVPGQWQILVDAASSAVGTVVTAVPATDLPAVPGAGEALPKVPTPTTADHRGVNPICTRGPACPFHDKSLDQLIGGTKPIALIVSTPAFCQVAICGPVLDLFVKRKAQLAAKGIEVIHAEVYVNDQAKQVSPTVNALGLDYEPALFLAKGDGTVVKRLDYIFDGAELDQVLSTLS